MNDGGSPTGALPSRAERLNRLRFGREHGKLLLGSGVGWALDAMDVGLISYIMTALAAEWAPLSIRVNAIAPGYFRTAMTDVFYRDDAWQSAMLDKIPMHRFGQLGDLAGAVVFLASDASAYVTGQCIPVDGGYLASI